MRRSSRRRWRRFDEAGGIQQTEFSAGDAASAHHQLSLISVTAAAIAKKTGRTKTTVESTLKAKASTTGTKALEDGYTLDMALVMAEFEGDQDAIEELESAIRDEPQYFDYIAQKLRDDRESKVKLAALMRDAQRLATKANWCSMRSSAGCLNKLLFFKTVGSPTKVLKAGPVGTQHAQPACPHP